MNQDVTEVEIAGKYKLLSEASPLPSSVPLRVETAMFFMPNHAKTHANDNMKPANGQSQPCGLDR